ncbi:hypothetical protein KO481_08015 [Nocardia sp. NEAU-G5]|uniref:Uncharacterized protein n=1 Tax=Nocardia albiluteola TaxID=2842303 RepID=A0ABS6ATV8_9NOCA|nr:hypothetical protein [Nocardia albiluteola]MBU3061467.1 hypothetical protein [Nocardia albiluteola]
MQFAPDDAGHGEAAPASTDLEAILRDIQIQLRGPELSGWPQLGSDTGERHRTVVEALAAALTQIAELRTEIGDLEATVADLEHQVRDLSPHRLPWPLSLAEGALLLLGEQVARLESLLPDLPGREPDRP